MLRISGSGFKGYNAFKVGNNSYASGALGMFYRLGFSGLGLPQLLLHDPLVFSV